MMDALDSLQGSASLDSKAERIARYKAERRRELAERYANLEESSSNYTRRERQRDTSDAGPNSEQKEVVFSGLCQHEDESKTGLKYVMDATLSSKISTANSYEKNKVARSCQVHSLLEAEEAQKPKVARLCFSR